MADGFARDLRQVDSARLVAVTSRRRVAADDFASRHGCLVHDTLSDLAEDPAIDVVYVATPNHRHAADSLTASELARPSFARSRLPSMPHRPPRSSPRHESKGCSAWRRCGPGSFPRSVRAIEVVERGDIGEIRGIHVDFSINAPYEPAGRLFDPSQGGGALLDLGVYGLALSSWLLGAPSDVRSTATFSPTGVDDRFAALLHHDGGAIATVSAALTSTGPNEAVIAGTRGTIRLPGPICSPRSLRIVTGHPKSDGVSTASDAVRPRPRIDRTVRLARGAAQALNTRRGVERRRFPGSGYHFEVAEVVDCLRQGRNESRLLRLHDTLTVMTTLDRVRSSWDDQ